MATVNLEHLVGQRVLGENGKTIGRIEEIRAEKKGGDLVIVEYHVGNLCSFRTTLSVVDRHSPP